MHYIRKRPFDISHRFLIFGILFGGCFPFAAWLLDSYLQSHPMTFTGIQAMHLANPLHWSIDMAPFVLGVFAYQIGKRKQAEVALAASEARFRDPELAHIPVVMVSIVDDLTTSFALEAADYLPKPIERDRFLAIINKHLPNVEQNDYIGAERHN